MYEKTAEIITAHSDNTNSNMLSLEKQSDNETFHISQLPILFNTMDLGQRRITLSCLYDATGNPEYHDMVRESSIIPFLIEHLMSSDDRTAIYAAGILYHLSTGSLINRDAIRLEHGIPALVICLASDKHSDLNMCAVTALSNLCNGIHLSGDEIRETGGIPSIIKLLRTSERLEIKSSAATALGNLAFQNPRNSKCIRENGGISLLIELLNYTHRDVVYYSVHALFVLSKDDDNKADIGSVASLLLINIFSLWPEAEIQRVTLGLLANLANHAANRQCILKNGGMDIFIQNLSASDREIQLHAAVALFNMALGSEGLDVIKNTHIIDKIVKILKISEGETRQYVLGSLLILVRNNLINYAYFSKKKAVLPLIDALDSPDVKTKRYSAEILSLLVMYDADAAFFIYDNKGISALIRCLTTDDNLTIRYALLALANSAREDFLIQNQVRQENGIPRIIILLNSSDAAIRQYAAGMMANLTFMNPENREVLRAYGGIQVLESCLHSTDELTKKRATLALRNMGIIVNDFSQETQYSGVGHGNEVAANFYFKLMKSLLITAGIFGVIALLMCPAISTVLGITSVFGVAPQTILLGSLFVSAVSLVSSGLSLFAARAHREPTGIDAQPPLEQVEHRR